MKGFIKQWGFGTGFQNYTESTEIEPIGTIKDRTNTQRQSDTDTLLKGCDVDNRVDLKLVKAKKS